MKNTKFFFILASIGIVFALVSVQIYSIKGKALPPLTVNTNPYANGIYASGIIESSQTNGSNINIYPEVSGRVAKVFVTDGQEVTQGAPLLALDDTVQKAVVAKDAAQANAALAALEQLKATPRPESLAIATAQVNYAQASLKNTNDQLEKLRRVYRLNAKAISQNTLDDAINAANVAAENLKVVQAQYALIKAGAWGYEIKNQENQYQAALQTYQADKALLGKYVITAPVSGTVLRVAATPGSYVSSSQGIYDTYTQGSLPIATMGVIAPYLAVRCYVDELLIAKLPPPSAIQATLLLRGESNHGIPLEFVRIQPYTIPNVELSTQRALRVDVRVLPIIFKFKKPNNVNLYLGQLVDVYIKGVNAKNAEQKSANLKNHKN